MADLDVVPKHRSHAWIWWVVAIVIILLIAWWAMAARHPAVTGLELAPGAVGHSAAVVLAGRGSGLG